MGRDDKKITIIGIGSSAGGLEAIRELVATLPTSLNVAYVVVQHMSPHHKSLMTELVARQTSLEVKDVKDGTKPEPSVIYVTPPNTDIVYEDGKLRLVQPGSEIVSPKPSVDRFLLSLADKHGENSMAIILSGTGSDGAYGVQAIREA
ncbi:MAG: chemotaxis protein CheB, partial [Roseobacter sp.]